MKSSAYRFCCRTWAFTLAEAIAEVTRCHIPEPSGGPKAAGQRPPARHAEGVLSARRRALRPRPGRRCPLVMRVADGLAEAWSRGRGKEVLFLIRPSRVGPQYYLVYHRTYGSQHSATEEVMIADAVFRAQTLTRRPSKKVLSRASKSQALFFPCASRCGGALIFHYHYNPESFDQYS
jgi:hypothetical protein